jgi:uncharacterized SAM-binding protein YcdF (DUF218 family)
LNESWDAVLVFAAEYDKKTRDLDQDTKSRLSRGLEIWRKDTDKKIIVAGGVKHPTIVGRRIAHDMRDWLIQHKVPSNKIIIEPDSANTAENLINSFAIIRSGDYKNIVLVSNRLHLRRIQYLIGKLWYLCDGTSFEYQPSERITLWNIGSEAFSWGKIFVKGGNIQRQ